MWWFSRKGPSGFSASSTAEQVTQGIDGTGLTAIVTGHNPSGLIFFFSSSSSYYYSWKEKWDMGFLFLEFLLLYYQSIVENMGWFLCWKWKFQSSVGNYRLCSPFLLYVFIWVMLDSYFKNEMQINRKIHFSWNVRTPPEENFSIESPTYHLGRLLNCK